MATRSRKNCEPIRSIVRAMAMPAPTAVPTTRKPTSPKIFARDCSQ
ncbi:hypothetical protein ACFQMM_12015 [Saliphagus sp. GCM10025308]